MSNHRNHFLRASLIVGALLAQAGCTSKVNEPDSSPFAAQPSAAAVEAPLRRLQIRTPERSASDIKQVAAKVLSIVAGTASPPQQMEMEPVTSSPQPAFALAATGAHASLRARYEASTDLFEVSDIEISSVRDGTLVSEAEARQQARLTFDRLVAAGLVPAERFSFADAELRRVMQGAAASDGPLPVETIKEYRFLVPLKLDGIRVSAPNLRDLGVKIAVHRSGAVRNVRVSGLGLLVQAAAGSVKRTVSVDDLDERVVADFPNAEIKHAGLRYLLDSADGEPQQTYGVVSRFTTPDGFEAVARGKIAYYSISDASRAADVLPRPSTGGSGLAPRNGEPPVGEAADDNPLGR